MHIPRFWTLWSCKFTDDVSVADLQYRFGLMSNNGTGSPITNIYFRIVILVVSTHGNKRAVLSVNTFQNVFLSGPQFVKPDDERSAFHADLLQTLSCGNTSLFQSHETALLHCFKAMNKWYTLYWIMFYNKNATKWSQFLSHSWSCGWCISENKQTVPKLDTCWLNDCIGT